MSKHYETIIHYSTVHNTANVRSAANEISYMLRNNHATSSHYAVDDQGIIQGIEDNRNAWHCGDGTGKGNMTSIGVEICFCEYYVKVKFL